MYFCINYSFVFHTFVLIFNLTGKNLRTILSFKVTTG